MLNFVYLQSTMTLYKELIAIYWEWHIDKVGFKPLIDKSDGEGLKKMIK